jgi:hypothetical protein
VEVKIQRRREERRGKDYWSEGVRSMSEGPGLVSKTEGDWSTPAGEESCTGGESCRRPEPAREVPKYDGPRMRRRPCG